MLTIKEKIKNWLKKNIEIVFSQIFSQKGRRFSLTNIPLETSFQVEHGDYTTSLPFLLAKKLKEEPQKISLSLRDQLNKMLLPEIEKIEIAKGGYLNFFLKKPIFTRELIKTYSDFSKEGNSLPRKNTTIIIDYSSPNIAKPMHVGHLRSTIIGNALANIYTSLGYRVIRWNYLGDWGTQFGQLIAAYKLWGDKQQIEKDPLSSLLHLYQKFHQEMKQDPSLAKQGQEEFRKLEKGNKENVRLWKWFKQKSLKDLQEIYSLLGIKFNIQKGESDFDKYVPALLRDLSQRGLTKRSKGALIVPLDKFNLPPALLEKSDGATLYLARDLACLLYRVKKYRPAQILYVVANEQSLYFRQLFAVAQLLNLPFTKLVHVKFGLVLDVSGKKFSTREGRLITLQSVINKGVKQALSIIQKKNPSWPLKQQQDTAKVIALDALKFNDLKEFRLKDVKFSWKRMLNLAGDSSVYVQYTYARLNKILVKGKDLLTEKVIPLEKEEEVNLIKKILDFPSVIEQSAADYAPNYLANYLLSLADLSNRYYEKVPILKEEDIALRQSRLFLLRALVLVFSKGLRLLGITPLTEI